MMAEFLYCDGSHWLGVHQSWNVLSNAGFFVLAWLVWREPSARWHRFGLVGIGVASSLWHGSAYFWALLLDITAIIAWAGLFIYDAARFYVFSLRVAYGGLLVFVGVSGVSAYLLADVFPLLSGAFVPYGVALLVAPYALNLSVRQRAYCWFGAVGLSLAIVAREVDLSVCEAMPMGTHVLWHLVIAAVISIPIVILCQHTQRLSHVMR